MEVGDSFLESIANGSFQYYYWMIYGGFAILGLIMVIRQERKRKARDKMDEEDIPDELD